MTTGTERRSITDTDRQTDQQADGQAGQSTPASALLVAGMHRSGTSALTRVLNLLGYRLADDLLVPNADNVTGFWESSSLKDLHDRALATMRLRWSTPAARDDSWFGTAEGKSFAVELGDSLRRWFPGSAPFAVKDPRMCRVIPAWRSVLEGWGVPCTFVIPVRHPVEVASSLKTRGGIPIESGLLLWLWYVLDAERDTRGADRSFLSYEGLLADWRGVLARVAQETGRAWPIEVEKVGEAVDEFLRPDLRHQRFSGPINGGELHGWVDAVYTEVLKAADHGLASLDTDVIDGVRREVERADALYGGAIRDAERSVFDAIGAARYHEAKLSSVETASRPDAEAEASAVAGEAGAALQPAEDDRPAIDRAQVDSAMAELADRVARLERSSGQASAAQAPVPAVPAVVHAGGSVPEPAQPMRLKRIAKRIAGRGAGAGDVALFDADWYRRMYPDVPGNPKALREHYLRHGWREGRWPHPLFDPAFYLAANPDVAAVGLEPLAHYESMGWREGRDPNPLFSVAWYLARNPDIAALGIEPVGHYARDGWRDGRQPHPLFDVAMVRATDPELSAQGATSTDPLAAYLHGGWTRGARACELFDETFYRAQAQALPADADALTHYAGLGWRHGYDPAPWFVGEEIARTVPGSGLVERLGFVLSTDPELLETCREPAGADLDYTPDLRTAYEHKGGRWSIESRTYAAHHGQALSRIVRVGRAIEFPWLAPLGSRMTLTVRGVPAGHAADAAPVRVRATLIPLSGVDVSRGSEAGAAIDLGIASLRCGELRWSLMHLDTPVAPGRRYCVRLEGVADPGVSLAAGVSVFGWVCDTRRFPVVPHLEGRDGGIGLAERLLERKSMNERTARVAVLGPVGQSSVARTAAAAAWARDRFAGAAVEATVLDDAERALRFAENADVVILADDGHVPRHAADADALPEALQGLGACTVRLRLNAPDRSSLALLNGAAKRPLATETQTDRRCHFAVEVTRDGAERWSASTPGGEMLLDRVGADSDTDGETDRATITPAALHDAAWGTILPRVVIVTVLYRKSAVVERFLGAIDRQTYAGPLSVVMVDDRSPDDDAVKARAYWDAHEEVRRDGRSLKILVNEENTGNCGSRNRGIAETDGDIYIVIDCDCLLNDGFVEAHVREHLLGNAEVVCGPLNIEAGDRDPEEVVRELDGDRDAILEAANPQDALVANGFVNCITRNVSIAAKYAKQGDLFDEAFAYSAKPGSGFGWEDVEMGASLYKQGARIVFIDDAYSVHCTHPASGDEAALCRGSARNFVRLSEKHPDLPLIARRWMSETAGKINAWARSSGAADSGNTADFETLRETYARGRAISAPHLAMRDRLASLGRPLRVLTYRWHAPHQYELYKLPCEFTLATGLGTGMVDVWSYDQRPLRDNARLVPMDRVDPSEFDCAILHFDENILSVDSTNGVIGHDWGSAFRAALEWDIPKVAICHGTPQFEGQYGLLRSPLASFAVYESERKQLVEALRDVPVVCNSWQALDEWGFEDARVIWHGFDPQEFAPGTYERAVLTHGADPNRPHYRGESVYNEVLARLEGVRIDTARHPGAPILRRTTNAYAVRNFRSYVDHIRKYTAYLNTTLRSPMPRSRGEAMMCGVIPVCLRNHDVEHFIRHGVNGFVGDSAPELASYIEHLLAHPADARRIGENARRTAMDVFNNDRFLAEWCDLLGAITGIGDEGRGTPGGHG